MRHYDLKSLLDPGSRTRRVEAVVFLIACIAIGYAVHAFASAAAAGNAVLIEPDADAAVDRIAEGQPDLSRFKHTEPLHARLPCTICHKREQGVTVPKFSGHLPCAGCHQQQFADNSNAICTICHTNPASGAVKRFPGLRSFTAKFDHGRHVRQTGCATCHSTNRRGAGLSVPSGGNAHATCFRCHGPEAQSGGQNIGSCNTCHQLGRPVRASDASNAYSKNFSHQEHIRKGMNCTSCHQVRAGMARGRQVTEPVVSMHFPPAGVQSCGACHNSKRAFGISSFDNCRRCHENSTFRF